MGNKIIILIVVMLFLVAGGFAFFFLLNSSEKNSVYEEKKVDEKNEIYAGEVSTLAFELSELPEGFSIAERTPRTISDVSQEGLDLGWKEGYYAKYIKGEGLLDISVIEINISRYPLENIFEVLNIQLDETEELTIELLTDHTIAEGSRAIRITDKVFENRGYVIELYKKDIYLLVGNSGSVTDYELIKELAKKVADKI